MEFIKQHPRWAVGGVLVVLGIGAALAGFTEEARALLGIVIEAGSQALGVKGEGP